MSINWADEIAALEARNIAEGKCPKCGGAGVVADLRAIASTHNPHCNKKCSACGGTGTPRTRR